MGSVSRLAKKCRECPFVEKCDKKRMEALAYLDDAAEVASMNAAAPVLRETMSIYVDGQLRTVYKDDIEKELYKALYCDLGLQYGG